MTDWGGKQITGSNGGRALLYTAVILAVGLSYVALNLDIF